MLYSETIKTFANNVLNSEGGTHLTGFRSALTRVINDYARKSGLLKEKEENLSGEDCREGLTAVILVKFPIRNLKDRQKTSWVTRKSAAMSSKVMTEYFNYYLDENPAIA